MSQSEPVSSKARVTEHTQRHSGGILRRYSIIMDVKYRKVTRVDKLHRTIVVESSHNESRELSRKAALAENAVGAVHHVLEWEARFGKTAKRCMEMAHEHRRSYALAGNIPKH